LSKEKKSREPIREACGIVLADTKLAIACLSEVELAKSRLDAFEYAIQHLYSRQYSNVEAHLQEAIHTIRGELYKDINFQYNRLLQFATINEEVRKIVQEELKKKLKEKAEHLHDLAEHHWLDVKEGDIRKLMAIKLGVDPDKLGIKDEEEE